ncbi:hypothetical protein [Uliginosibacterium sp. H1]|uniref:hypothetical protein n=1 Tax=Uliginosibacterium sp. H1 TaxID=3114757 RepID=UPI002E17854A|nr:hypothetical protein [Uliginosibacterium sp. H1]
MTRTTRPRNTLVAFILAAFAAPSMAVDFSYQGFGTVAAGRTLGAGQQALVDGANFAAYDNEWSAATESRLGVRARASLDDTWSATLQGTSYASEQGRISVQSAYVGYMLNPDWELTLGRRQNALYYYSDFLPVGYAYHWIRPPTEVYGISPFTTYDGLGLQGKAVLGGWRWQLSLALGQSSNVRYSDDAKRYTSRVSRGAYDTVEDRAEQRIAAQLLASDGPWTFGATITSLDLVREPQNPTNGARTEEAPVRYYGLIARWDGRQAFVIGEGAYVEAVEGRRANSIYAGYISAGLKLGIWTPHFTYGAYGERQEVSTRVARSHSETIGLRVELGAHAALKMDYNRVHPQGSYQNAQFISATGRRNAELFSAALDFTF